MWVCAQGPVRKISMETHKNHLVISGRCIKSLHMSVVFVIISVMIPMQQRPLRTNSCAEEHCSKFPQRVLVYIHRKPFWTGPAQDIN